MHPDQGGVSGLVLKYVSLDRTESGTLQPPPTHTPLYPLGQTPGEGAALQSAEMG